jgi:hypothetical protein
MFVLTIFGSVQGVVTVMNEVTVEIIYVSVFKLSGNMHLSSVGQSQPLGGAMP